MIDSVLLRQEIESRPRQTVLNKFVRRGEQHYSFKDAASENSPHLFFRSAPDGRRYLSVEVSLPKLLFGHNLRLLTEAELRAALNKLSRFASERFDVEFDARAALVGRVDYCANFDVGEDKIHAYLQAAMEARPPCLKRRAIGKLETVEFFNSGRKIYLYDKNRQSTALLKRKRISTETAETARGLIRLETRFGNPVAIERMLVGRLHLPDRSATTVLNFTVARTALSEALGGFELHKPVGTIDQRIEKLQTFCGGYGRKFQQLLGFIQLCDYFGQDNLLARGIVKRASFYRYINDLRRAGALVFTTYHSPLPGLTVK